MEEDGCCSNKLTEPFFWFSSNSPSELCCSPQRVYQEGSCCCMCSCFSVAFPQPLNTKVDFKPVLEYGTYNCC
ncbi:hypothetical protein QL285_059692 [Trifolium repens]|nr:hypothetical protein QL285_059692 [Trifolium repens]